MLAILAPLLPRQLAALRPARSAAAILSSWQPHSTERPHVLLLWDRLQGSGASRPVSVPRLFSSNEGDGGRDAKGDVAIGESEAATGELPAGATEVKVVAAEGEALPAESEPNSPLQSEGLSWTEIEGGAGQDRPVKESLGVVPGPEDGEGRGRKRRRKGAEVLTEASGSETVAGDPSETSIVPAGPRPENFPTVLAVPLTRRPLFPGFYIPVNLKNSKLAEALAELKARGTPYVGAFLVKDKKGSASPPFGPTGDGEGAREIAQHGRELYERLHEYGTFAQITQVVRALDGESAQVLLLGHRRLRMTGVVEENPLTVSVEHLKDEAHDAQSDVIKATVMEVVSTMKDLMRLNPLYKEHIAMFVQHVGEFNASRMADFGAALTTADEPSLQAVVQELKVDKRLDLTLVLLKKELELSRLQASIARGVEEKISGEQRKYLLQEQLKAIKKELGLEKDDKTALVGKFRDRLEPFREACPPQVLQVIEEEIAKLQGLEGSSSEFNVTRNYLDWLTSLPWGHYSEENFDVKRASEVLDAEHYGLEDVKERILEFIAVGRLRGTAQGKIICLVGPPGVGKTSIGRSIAHALNRKFYRFSVGGLGDVAEIKGHRRTYVGAMPGKMVQCLKATQSANPLVLIDEIDKLGRGHSGDPASALLELLDPEQNANFVDHYLDVPIDLSKVLFVCTANVLDSIPGPLLDRMEVIRLVGYITAEKMHIARGYLEPTARKASGVAQEQVDLTEGALHSLVEEYCREAGVRSLQKHIEKIYRKVALQVVRREAEMEAAAPHQQQQQQEQEEEEEVVPEALVVEEGAEVPARTALFPQDLDADAEIADRILEGTETEAYDIARKLMAEEEGKRVLETFLVEEAAREKGPGGKEEGQESSAGPSGGEAAPAGSKGGDGEREPRVIGDPIVISEANLPEYAGQPVFQNEKLYEETPVGVVMGLAWTAMGGSTLYVETSIVEQGEGKGSLQLTGQLGDVMKESASIAYTVARRMQLRSQHEGDAPWDDFFSRTRLHLHVPAGATPKDGPSAGCTMITSLLSLALGRAVRPELAMTGEVTLTGRVLPIGGVKEKTVAARRSGVKTIVFPSANKRDFEELPDHVKEDLDVHFVHTYDEIFKLAFEYEQPREGMGGAVEADFGSA